MEETQIHQTMIMSEFQWQLHIRACGLLTTAPEMGTVISLLLTDEEADKDKMPCPGSYSLLMAKLILEPSRDLSLPLTATLYCLKIIAK